MRWMLLLDTSASQQAQSLLLFIELVVVFSGSRARNAPAHILLMLLLGGEVAMNK